MTESVYSGDHVSLSTVEEGIVKLTLDHKKSSVNKFDTEMVQSLDAAIDQLVAIKDLKGVIVETAKDSFVVGADITRFREIFVKDDQEFASWVRSVQKIFNRFEDLEVPTVAAIQGHCLGGGFEFALACSYRVASTDASIGLPETKLGIIPGWGGTVRLPRLVGADNAIEWIAMGSANKPEAALSVGAVDAVVAKDQLFHCALATVKLAISGDSDWKARRQEKMSPLKFVSPVESVMVFEGAKGFVLGKAGKNYPAPIEAINAMQAAAGFDRDRACEVEIESFIKMARTTASSSLVGIYLGDQFNKKQMKHLASEAPKVEKAAVIGAGIMGGGIAYQTASQGTSIVMKDISTSSLEAGMSEASKLLSKQVQRGKIDAVKMAKTLAKITPVSSYGEFDGVDMVVEAIVENEAIKKKFWLRLKRRLQRMPS